jgi:hypothetical protein
VQLAAGGDTEAAAPAPGARPRAAAGVTVRAVRQVRARGLAGIQRVRLEGGEGGATTASLQLRWLPSCSAPG